MKELETLSFNDRNYMTEEASSITCDCNNCPSECDCGDSDCIYTP